MFVRSSSVAEEVVGIWQAMVTRIEMVEAYLRFVKVGKIVEINKMCFRRRPKVRAFKWESYGGR